MNTLTTIPGPLAVDILRAAFPQKPKSPTAIADIHMYLYGHTKNISKPIDNGKHITIR